MTTEPNTFLAVKTSIARSQLGTAMDLFIRDKDPVSIQVLTCGACEVLESIVSLTNQTPITTHILEMHPNLNLKKLYKARNVFWNAFKHVTNHNGNPRSEDIDHITDFCDADNDSVLFLAWYDYLVLTRRLPISAQVFQIWFYALKPWALDVNDGATQVITGLFPDLQKQPRQEQKRRLRRAIEKYRSNKAFINDPRTEPENYNYLSGVL